ncbi:UDP-galactopyranose mutase [Candidatus Phyllobacterium onerii]|uniref:UDP-galactopyranose mutase n=1 Tax=Candidatus Phyllobacterium onerii TaxID=3020828 RepID=UPI00232B3612|nr:UDP-galactopyranose mutase [Phyllobacterium sp. IY22]
MTRAAKGGPVYFIEEPTFQANVTPHLAIKPTAEGVIVAVPVLPIGLDDAQIVQLQRQLLDDLYVTLPISRLTCWYYTPMALVFSRHIVPDMCVYDNMDELSAFRGASTQMLELEQELFSRADLVFTGGRALFEAKSDRHSNIHCFPSSIDVAHFSKARAAIGNRPDREPAAPRLGFFGVIDERLDLDLIRQASELRPGWQFIMIGPVVKIDPTTLPQAQNLHWLGAREYADLPECLADWDIGIMPFAINASTEFISPTKTPEFLAAGVPVISTEIKDVVRPYGDMGLVEIADSAGEFIAKAEHLLARPRKEWLARVDDFLATMSWDMTWEAMTTLMHQVTKPAAKQMRFSLSRNLRAFDWLITGAGFAGSVLAERLASQRGDKVLLIDKRPHIGGNAYDVYNSAGLLIHKYGPHIFHTNSDQVLNYLSAFTKWRPYEHRVLAEVDKMLLPIPINLDTINKLYGLSLSSEELEQWFQNRAEHVDEIRTSEDVVVSRVGRELYEKFFRGYTRKQWGVDPSELDKSVTARVPTRTDRDDRYFADKHQCMPAGGYTRMFERMLDHPNIKIMLQTNFDEIESQIEYRRLIYTGPVDEYFGFRYGKLPYRSLRFHHVTLDKEWHQSVAVVNYPMEHEYTRVTEYKHLTGQQSSRTSLTYEFPSGVGDPYYPVPNPENAELYKKYDSLARATRDVLFVGRLATYKYYNMDQVVGQALATFRRIEAEIPRSRESRQSETQSGLISHAG